MKNLKMNKKGSAFILLGVAFLLIAIAISFSQTGLLSSSHVGENQYKILQGNEKTQLYQSYITQSSNIAADKSQSDLFANAGIYQEPSDLEFNLAPPCGTYQYVSYSKEGLNCTPDYRDSYKDFFINNLNSYLSSNPQKNLQFAYDLNFEEKLSSNKVRILAMSDSEIRVGLGNESSSQNTVSQNNLVGTNLFGGFSNEKKISCGSGDCLADTANYFYQDYISKGIKYPYVWGGESPYPLQDTLKIKNDPKSFFYGVSVTPKQPSKSIPTVPGFDCSGWVWWVGKHAGIKDLSRRVTAATSLKIAKKHAQQICSNDIDTKCYIKNILQLAKPGDILYYGNKLTNITHIMIYIGDGKISHSRGSKGLTEEKIPTTYANDKHTKIMAIYRFPYVEGGVNRLSADVSNSDTNSNNQLTKEATSKDATKDTSKDVSKKTSDTSKTSTDASSNPGSEKNSLETKSTPIKNSLNDFSKLKKVAVFGSSTVEGGQFIDELRKAYPNTVFDKFGIHGDAAVNALKTGRFEKQVLDGSHDGTIILMGLNDIVTYSNNVNKITTALQSMYDQAKNKGLFVIAVTIQPWKDFMKDTRSEEKRLKYMESTKKLNDWILNDAKNVDLVVDSYSKLEDPNNKYNTKAEFASSDKLHLNSQGQKLLGDTIVNTIKNPLFQTINGGNSCQPLVKPLFDENLVKNKVVSIDVLEKKFEQYDVEKIILEAHEKFPLVPVEMIKAIIGAEVGGAGYIDKYLSEGAQDFEDNKACNSVGYCGPMQVGKTACNNLVTKKTYPCSYEKIQAGDVREGIISGTGVLSRIISTSKYLNKNNLDYYMVAIGYNAGVGSLNQIVLATSKRTGKNPYDITFADMTKNDIIAGMKNIKADWAHTQAKWDEIWLYPQKVGKVLSEQCSDGSINSFGHSSSDLFSNSYILFKPYIDTTINMNFVELEKVQNFVQELQTNCKNNLVACVNNQINDFNNKNKNVKITINNEDNALARDLIDQMIDCNNNGQDKCICPIKVNTKLNTENHDEEVIRLKSDNSVVIGEESRSRDLSLLNKKLFTLPVYPTAVSIDETKSFKYVDFIIEKDDSSDNRFEIEKSGFDTTWNLNVDENYSSEVALSKNSKGVLTWIQYPKDKQNVLEECRDVKKNFRFQAHFSFTNKLMDFAVYLNDSVAPKLNLLPAQQGFCSGNPILKLSWEIPKNTDLPFDFIINLSDVENNKKDNESFEVFNKLKEPYISGESKDLFQLYEEDGLITKKYYLFIDKLPSGENLQINKTYKFMIYARDNYLNLENSSSGNLKIVDSEVAQVAKTITGSDVGSVISTINKLLDFSLCPQAYHRVVKFQNNTIVGWRSEGTEDTNSLLIQRTGSNGEISFDKINLTPYPGIFNPENGEQLYWIKDIPNIVCQEKSSSIGKICATTLTMMKQLALLSQNELVPNNEKLIVRQAFRTKEIQLKAFASKNYNSALACDPNKANIKENPCPHMVAGALDVNIYKNEKGLSSSEQETLLCKYGFLRYSKESWHFEYGTRMWDLAEKKRAKGETVCRY